jgi:hypothetical protein
MVACNIWFEVQELDQESKTMQLKARAQSRVPVAARCQAKREEGVGTEDRGSGDRAEGGIGCRHSWNPLQEKQSVHRTVEQGHELDLHSSATLVTLCHSSSLQH